MRLPLIDGQGNFGSVDGDPPAADALYRSAPRQDRATCCRGYRQRNGRFQPNYDDSRKEPLVLPSRFPNLLVNGAGGIAVGMATNIPPHNLGEVIDACLAYLEDQNVDPHRRG